MPIPGESNAVLVVINSGVDCPGDHERATFNSLLVDLPALSDKISEALYSLYAPYEDLSDWPGPIAGSPRDLRAILELSNVFISTVHPPELLFGFRGDDWPDAMFSLAIEGAEVSALALDD